MLNQDKLPLHLNHILDFLKGRSGERKVRSWGFPCLVALLLTGNPSKSAPQVKHLFKRAGSGDVAYDLNE
jgi:hypothetical protein